jgi:predicted nucleotidyltransferase
MREVSSVGRAKKRNWNWYNGFMKKQEIVDYLRKVYKPSAIILHGSRATGNEREHSDWDIFLIFKETPTKNKGRERIVGEDVEWKVLTIPIDDNKIYDNAGVFLQYAEVLWEEETVGTDLMNQAKRVYSLGSQIDPQTHDACRQFLEHKLNGMKDDVAVNDYALFLKHHYEFFLRAVNWWFEILHNENQKPFYIAFPTIKERDLEYYGLLMALCGDCSKSEKIEAGTKIIPLLFKNTSNILH